MERAEEAQEEMHRLKSHDWLSVRTWWLYDGNLWNRSMKNEWESHQRSVRERSTKRKRITWEKRRKSKDNKIQRRDNSWYQSWFKYSWTWKERLLTYKAVNSSLDTTFVEATTTTSYLSQNVSQKLVYSSLWIKHFHKKWVCARTCFTDYWLGEF